MKQRITQADAFLLLNPSSCASFVRASPHLIHCYCSYAILALVHSFNLRSCSLKKTIQSSCNFYRSTYYRGEEFVSWLGVIETDSICHPVTWNNPSDKFRTVCGDETHEDKYSEDDSDRRYSPTSKIIIDSSESLIPPQKKKFLVTWTIVKFWTQIYITLTILWIRVVNDIT